VLTIATFKFMNWFDYLMNKNNDFDSGFEYLEHMTDAYIEARGTTLDLAFSNAAKGFVDTAIHMDAVDMVESELITIKANNKFILLHDWLESILLKLYVENKVFRDFDVSISDYSSGFMLKANLMGEPLNIEKHKPKVEIKAITFHLMEINEAINDFTVKFILDL